MERELQSRELKPPLAAAETTGGEEKREGSTVQWTYSGGVEFGSVVKESKQLAFWPEESWREGRRGWTLQHL